MIHDYDTSFQNWRSATHTVVPRLPPFYNPLFKTTLEIRPLDLAPKGNFLLNYLYFKTTCNIRPPFLGSMSGLKIEGPMYSKPSLAKGLKHFHIGLVTMVGEDDSSTHAKYFTYHSHVCSVWNKIQLLG